MPPDAPVVAVFCSSADGVGRGYHDLAARLGHAIAQHGWGLLYGGTPVGTMGTLAGAAREGGARVIGVPLTRFVDLGVHDLVADELLTAATLGTRKDLMLSRADAFVGLPGGYGTVDEIVEVISQRQLAMHAKPMVLLNHEGLFTPLLAFFELLYAQGLAYPNTLGAYHAVDTLEAAVTALVHHFASLPSGP